jgi:hypothetical protein
MSDHPLTTDQRVWVDDRIVAHMLDYWRSVKIRLVETEHKQAERDMAAAFVAVIEEVQWRRAQEERRRERLREGHTGDMPP